MLRLGLTTTGSLAGRTASTSTRGLPFTGACAFAALHRAFRSAGPACSCRQSAGASCSGQSPYSHDSRIHGGTRRSTLMAAAAVASASVGPTAMATDAPAACDPSAYQSLSLLFLLHECARRAYGRPLVECADLLTLPTRLESLPCCIMLLAPVAPPALTPVSRTPAATSSAATDTRTAAPAGGSRVQSERVDAGAASSSGRGVAGGGGGGGGVAGASGDSGSGSSRGSPLRLQYANRAAAEALKLAVPGGGSGGTGDGGAGGQRGRAMGHAPLVDETGEEAELLHEVLASRGEPRRGALTALILRTADPPRAGGAACGVPISCSEALVLPLMSPNGACAGAAVLFDRWEVRDSGSGRVVLEGRPLVPEIPPGSVPSEQQLAELQERVRSQADAVRALKTQRGLPNQDPRVVAAVAELQRLKTELDLQQRLRSAFGAGPGPLQQLLAAE